MNVLLLFIRLTQTSLMIVFSEQKTQAMLASCIAIFSACLHRELDPYRRRSDNMIALMAQWLIYFWVLALLARLIHVLGSAPAVLIGLLLVGASLFVVGYALRAAHRDLEAEREDVRLNRDAEVEMTERSSEEDLPATAHEEAEEAPSAMAPTIGSGISNAVSEGSWPALAAGALCATQDGDGDSKASSTTALPLCI